MTTAVPLIVGVRLRVASVFTVGCTAAVITRLVAALEALPAIAVTVCVPIVRSDGSVSVQIPVTAS